MEGMEMTKKQRSAMPQYIVYIDKNASARIDNNDSGIYCKAMEETDIISAMQRAEECIKKAWDKIYLLDIYGKTEEINEHGEPLYKSIIMTRVHGDESKPYATIWHFRDREHGETPHGLHTWWQNPDSREGKLQFERYE